GENKYRDEQSAKCGAFHRCSQNVGRTVSSPWLRPKAPLRKQGRTNSSPYIRRDFHIDSFDSRHRVSVHKLPVAERELTMRAFDLKSEFAIQRDRGLVVRVNGQFDSRKVQPFIGKIYRRLHQGRADALALPVVAHHHSDIALMPDSRPRSRMQADHADDFVVN